MSLSMIVTAATLGTTVFGAVERNESEFLPPRIELTFTTDYREALSIIDTVAQQPLVADERITQAKLLKVYDASNPPLKHGGEVADEMEGSNAPKVLVGKDGILLWGPYTQLDAGHYLIVYRFKLLPAVPAAGTLFLDVAHNACTRSGLRLDAAKQPTGKWQEIAVPVHLPEAMKLEFRFWPDGNMTAIDRIYVFQVTPGAPDRPAGPELPAGRPVAGRADVLRSPHTDDQGMIDVSGLASGARVRCPYTGKYFRVP
jgi:hypothetical protein